MYLLKNPFLDQEEKVQNEIIRRKMFRRKNFLLKPPPPLEKIHNNRRFEKIVKLSESNQTVEEAASSPITVVYPAKVEQLPKTVSNGAKMNPKMPKIASNANAKNRTRGDLRFLSLFTMVRFKNEGCISGTGDNGTCYTESECEKLDGQASGSCASGTMFGLNKIYSTTIDLFLLYLNF